MTQADAKVLVGKAAAALVKDGMAVGLGTGSTAAEFIKALGERVAAGLRVRCAASSEASTRLAESLGMRVESLPVIGELDLYVDGADEVAVQDGTLCLIKGGGGALLREKILAAASRRWVVVVDKSKMVETLGKFPLPVEVIQMAMPMVDAKLAALGLKPVLRSARAMKQDVDGPFITDEGNVILDCRCGVIEEPEVIAAEIRSIVGVVEHGLFLGMSREVLVAGENGVRRLDV